MRHDVGNLESNTPSRGEDELSPGYIPFTLARGEVARALRFPDDGAAEWLRQVALKGGVQVRFSDYYVKQHPINLRLAGHPSNLTEEERALPWPQPISPLDDLKRSPAAMAEHHIVYHTEWNAGQLRAVLGAAAEAGAAPAPVLPAESAKADRKGIGGAERRYPWDELGAAFGAWLHQEPGRASLRNKKHLDALADLAAKLGCEAPARSTAQPYLAKWLKGYRAYLKDED
jgi:hypothetical protein